MRDGDHPGNSTDAPSRASVCGTFTPRPGVFGHFSTTPQGGRNAYPQGGT